MKVWSAYLNEAIEVKSVTPERLVDDEIGGSGDSEDCGGEDMADVMQAFGKFWSWYLRTTPVDAWDETV